MNWMEIAGIVVVGLLGIWGGWKMWKHIPKEIAEAFKAVADAVEDDNITKEELKNILKEFADVVASVRKVF